MLSVLLLGLYVSRPAEATIIVVGPASVGQELSRIDADVRTLSVEDVEVGGFPTASVVVIGRLLPDGPSEAFLEQVEQRLLVGGGFVLFWDAAALLFDGFEPTYRFEPSRQLGWFSGRVGAGTNLVEPSPIVLEASGHEFWTDDPALPEELPWGDFPQFFLTVTDLDPLLEVVAAYRGDGTNSFPHGSHPALITGRACRARVVLVLLNISDVLPCDRDVCRMFRRAVNWAYYKPGPVRGPCPPRPDLDRDGVDAPQDNCPDDANRGQADSDGDGVGDRCDVCPLDGMDDADEDEFCVNEDNCPGVANVGQEDGDDDGVGDACDTCPGVQGTDADDDGYCPDVDNCPNAANADQMDLDRDGLGDACDPDRDGDDLEDALEVAVGSATDDPDTDDDGVLDGAEPQGFEDTDGDGLPGVLDPDSDDDALPDGLEMGVRHPPEGTDLQRGHFIPDADPETTTDPLEADTDRGGAPDGVEDVHRNGRVDPGEGDPNDPFDDERFLPRDAGPSGDAASSDTGQPDSGQGSDSGGDGETRDAARDAPPCPAPDCPDRGRCPEAVPPEVSAGAPRPCQDGDGCSCGTVGSRGNTRGGSALWLLLAIQASRRIPRRRGDRRPAEF